MSDKLTLELGLVLPEVPDERDACVGRLTALLREDGLEEAHVVQEDGSARLCLHYDAQRFGASEVRQLALAAGAHVSARYRHESLRIDGMDCATCATVIEHALQRLDGVTEASVSYAAERLRLEYDGEKVSRKSVIRRVEALGYAVLETGHHEGWLQEHRELLVSAAAGLLLFAGWLAGALGASTAVSLPFLLAAYAAGGYFTLRDAIQSLRAGRFEIDTLMLVAAAGAAVLGAWEEGALLLFLFSLGHALEHLAMDRARNAISALAQLAPKTALVRRDGTEQEVRVEDLLRGDRVIVKPGQRLPADGTIAAGSSAIDQSPVTGESIPVEKATGDMVFAGTVNGDGTLVIEVTKLTRESTLARMAELVAEAQAQKSPTQRFTERFERIFVPLVLVGAVLLAVLPPLFGMPWANAFYRAMAVLVAASPCALAIATPAAVLSGVARAARGGVLIKGGAHLESLGALGAIALDKTGTITRGQPRVTRIVALAGSEEDLLRVAAAAESRSAHPLARAVIRAAEERAVSWSEPSAVEAVTGKGLRATIDGRAVLIGNLALFGLQTVPETLAAEVARLETDGDTTMIVQSDGAFLGVIAVADTPRAGAREVLDRLRALGVGKIVMLTGDNERTARAVGRSVGLDEVRAGLLPEQKVEAVDALVRQYGRVAMIGDGVNDAPALAKATVGIAMGGAGTDVALETADAALMGDDLAKLPFAIALSRAARRVIRQNVWMSLGVVAALVPLTVLGIAGIGPAVLVHEGSTVVVVLNALRLLAFREEGAERGPPGSSPGGGQTIRERRHRATLSRAAPIATGNEEEPR